MRQKRQTTIPARNVAAYAVCFGMLLAVVLVVIVPNFGTLARLSEESDSLQAAIETQQDLFSVYQWIKKHYEEAQRFQKYTPPPPERLDAEGMLALIESLRRIFEENRFQDISVEFNMALFGQAKTIPVDTAARGDLLDLRNVLTRLIQLPYVAEIATIQAAPDGDGRMEMIRIKLLVHGATENAPPKSG